MNESDVQNILDQAQLARENPVNFDKQQLRHIQRQLHQLAEEQCALAQGFFLSCLSDLNSNWRLDGLRNLGFHYQFGSESEICEKVRFLLLNDPDDDIRDCAALVLGGRSKWLDSALLSALTSDPDESVRASAFQSLLELAGAPYIRSYQEGIRVKNKETEPTFEEVERIIAECGIKTDTLTEL